MAQGETIREDVKPRGIAYGSRIERPDADRAAEWCETFARIAEASVELSAQPMLDAIMQRFGCDDAYIHQYRRDGVFVCHAYRAPDPLLDLVNRTFDRQLGRVDELMCDARPVFTDYLHPRRGEDAPESAVEHGYVSSMSIPVAAGGSFFGIVSAVYRRPCPYDERDADILAQAGKILGCYSLRMYKSERETELKVLNERKLIAAEIHDDVAQLASSISIASDTVKAAYDVGNDEAVLRGMSKISEASRELNKKLRDQLVSLRSPLEESDGLVQGIDDALRRLETQWGIQTTFHHDEVPERVFMRGEVQLMRVVAECFSNIVKHSGAKRVDVSLTAIPKGYLLVISDDGCGFDVSQVPDDRFGLKIMRERMAMANGVLDIESTPKGTTVTAAVNRY